MTWAAVHLTCPFWKSGDGRVFQVKSTSGDTFLGGDDYDQRIMDYLIETFNKEQGMDLRQDRQALQASERSLGESQDRVVHCNGNRDQPALSDRGCQRAEALGDQTDTAQRWSN